jgi:hypothetical protein
MYLAKMAGHWLGVRVSPCSLRCPKAVFWRLFLLVGALIEGMFPVSPRSLHCSKAVPRVVFDFSLIENLFTQHIHHFGINARSAGDQRTGRREVVAAAVESCDARTGLFSNQPAGGQIPGLERQLPVAV